MDAQQENNPSAGKGPQNTPIEKLQQQDDRSNQGATPPSAEQQAQGYDYVVDRQIAEMEAGNVTPIIASDPGSPGVQDLVVGGTTWLASVNQPLPIYSQPGASATVATLAAGTQVSVIEGPQEQGGTSWVRVRTAEGQEGWVGSDDLGSS